jgi:hypothetical protein
MESSLESWKSRSLLNTVILLILWDFMASQKGFLAQSLQRMIALFISHCLMVGATGPFYCVYASADAREYSVWKAKNSKMIYKPLSGHLKVVQK